MIERYRAHSPDVAPFAFSADATDQEPLDTIARRILRSRGVSGWEGVTFTRFEPTNDAARQVMKGPEK